MRRKLIIGAFALASVIGITASIAVPAFARTCTTTCSGSGNYRTCTTHCY